MNGPPIALKKPYKVPFGAVEGENRGSNPFKDIRYIEDPWFWLRDDTRKNEEILDHIKKENDYTKRQTKHLESLKNELYAEHISHLKETDSDLPYKYGNFFYYTRTAKGKPYKFFCRKLAFPGETFPSPETKEEIYLDANKVAEGHKQCNILSADVSVDHTLLAYAADFTGYEKASIYIVNTTSGETLSDKMEGTSGWDIEWGKDNSILYYTTVDATNRAYKVWKHILGTSQSEDVCMFTENDESYNLGIRKSKDHQVLFVISRSKEESEVSFIKLNDPKETLVTIQPRRRGLKYQVEHFPNDRFFILANVDGAINNRLLITNMSSPSIDHWKEVIPYDSNREFQSVSVYHSIVVIQGRQDGLPQIWTLNVKNEDTFGIDLDSFKRMEWPDALYSCALTKNYEFNADKLTFYYVSPTTPSKWLQYDVKTQTFAMLKQKEVLNYDASLYTTKRIMAKANDGTMIPMSLVYRKSVDTSRGDTPTLIYGYGSYGSSIGGYFDASILPYLDRGMVYAIAHIRGGGEMGRYWYQEQGKYLNKRNTFSDFINCAEHLIETKLTNPSKLAMMGVSAGGLLMGAVMNMRPDLFKVAVAKVPFVDIMNTMSDASIPLTTAEWEEWGNPNEYKYFDYMLSYSPYDNVRAQGYPNVWISCGLNDPRVPYWEALKWASKLKTMKTDENEILVKIEMEAGHFSASNRYEHLEAQSLEQAFVLYHLGLGQP